ncbi:DedA family protein [bacterium]|nr:DedA family protein [bacterium]
MSGLKDFFLSLSGFWGCLFLFLSSLAENLFPPMPGDTFVVLGAFLVGRGQLAAVPAYAATTAGSLLGFMLLFFLGRKLGRTFFEGKHGRFFSEESLQRVEHWFDRYGYWVIGINRFLSGVRAVVSLAAGMAHMDWKPVFGLALVSCLIWNAALMALGIWMGENWELVLAYYQRIIMAALLLITGAWIIRTRIIRKKRSG